MTPIIIPGVRLSAVTAGIRRPGRKDMVLIELAESSQCAAVFTRNAFCAAPVKIAKQHLQATQPRYLLINSGNANAGTGVRGEQDALRCCELVAAQTGCAVNQVLPFSTGVIGEPLPMEKLAAAVPELNNALNEKAWQTCAEAIMTTDTRPKLYSTSCVIDGKEVKFTAMAKGSGMIRPDMATMLAYITTDAKLDSTLLQACLTEAVACSFNRITVDGDTSTNDACVLVATGQSGVAIESMQQQSHFQIMLNTLCQKLAKEIVRDGEGATKLITIDIENGKTEKECLQVAYAIAHSPLVKTAAFASDPNWGRILAAVGYAGVTDFDISKISIYLGDVCIVANGGRATDYSEARGAAVMQRDEISIRVDLARGEEMARVWTCDFSYDYVKINAEYRT